MSEAKDKKEEKDDKKPAKKTLSLGGTLSLKGAGGSSTPRPSVNRNTVSVEVRRKRTTTGRANTSANEDAEPKLTQSEREARERALKLAQEHGQRRSTLPKRQGPVAASKPAEEDKAEAKTPEDARAKELAELEQIESEESKLKAQLAENQARMAAHNSSNSRREGESEPTSYRDRLKKAEENKPRKPQQQQSRRGNRLTVNQAINRDFERDRSQSLAAQRRAREKARLAAMGPKEPAAKVTREVILPETITVAELANRMAEAGKDVIKELMKLGVMATMSQIIDADTAELVIDEMGHKVKRVTDADVEIGLEGIEDADADLKPRPPVVTIMGHVDHGKTSLLDAMRSTDVVSGEAGGITQHIGAYQVKTKAKNQITFLDTPGHAAFTEMRARGANVTDICVIVVAADDSIMPQTIEAINHSKAAEVPIIIAINKIDLPAADANKVRTELLQHEVVVEEMGGDVQCVEISATKKTNLDKLEESIMLQAEILELTANPDRAAQGFIVESKLEKGRGSVATVLIEKGTLKVGDIFVAGAEYGKVRAIINDRGDQIKQALPGQPVEVLGLNATPEAGDQLIVVEDDARAREVSEYRQKKQRDLEAAAAVKGRTTIDDLLAARDAGEKVTLSLIVKAGVHGSVEAIVGSLEKMVDDNKEDHGDIAIDILHTGVGGITESDVTLANASGGIIVGFNVRANTQARDLATREGVDIRYYNVIYDVIDDAKAVLSGMLPPAMREEYLGQAKIKEVFNITKVGKIAGCEVSTGMVKRGSKVRLLRDDVVIHEGMLKTLKRHKDEVKEVKEGMECGMAFENYDDLKEGDVIECFEVIEEERTVQ